MRKNTFKLTEKELKQIVKESVTRILKEMPENNSRRVITGRDLAAVLQECASYVEGDENADEYLMEIANTGLFHDAIGKVIQTAPGKIVITTEY